MSSFFGSSGFLSTGIRNFKDALTKGTDNLDTFGTVLSSKLRTVVGLANTLNEVENAEGRRKTVRLVNMVTQ